MPHYIPAWHKFSSSYHESSADVMNEYLIIKVFVALILLLLIGITSIKGYLSFKREKSERKLAHWFNQHQSFLLLAFLIFFLLCVSFSTFYYADRFLPPPVASPGDDVVTLFNVTTIITTFAFVITQILLFYFAFRFRSTQARKADYLIGKLKLELLWTVIPFGTFIFLFLWGQALWAKFIETPNDNAVEIEVMAEQFNWRIRYPGADKKLGRADFRLISNTNDMGIDEHDPNSKDDFIPLQMHVPKNKQVKIILRAKDVIHSFYIPHFRMKMDAVPGMTTSMHFTPTMSTREMREKLNNPNFDYEVACAELCGRMHFGMKLILIVDEPKTFEAWYRSQKSWMENLHTTNMNEKQKLP